MAVAVAVPPFVAGPLVAGPFEAVTGVSLLVGGCSGVGSGLSKRCVRSLSLPAALFSMPRSLASWFRWAHIGARASGW